LKFSESETLATVVLVVEPGAIVVELDATVLFDDTTQTNVLPRFTQANRAPLTTFVLPILEHRFDAVAAEPIVGSTSASNSETAQNLRRNDLPTTAPYLTGNISGAIADCHLMLWRRREAKTFPVVTPGPGRN
jgi:hypothetical protein